MLDKELEKNASFKDAVDVFKYKGNKYPIDTEIYRRKIPVLAKDYEHICRYPKDVIVHESLEMFGSLNMTGTASKITGATKNNSRRGIKDKFCTPDATRLKEPDMVCVPKMDWRNATCEFLMERSLEDIYEVGGGKYDWSSPYWGNKDKMLPSPWKEILYKEGSSLWKLEQPK